MILALFGFALTAAYCPAIAGGGSTPRWDIAAFAIPVWLIAALLTGREIKITAAHIAGTALLVLALASFAWTEAHNDSVDAMWKLALLGGCFALGSLIEDAAPLWIGAAGGIAISSGLVLIEATTGGHVAQGTPFAGLFVNRNYLTETSVLVMIGLFAHKRALGVFFWPLAIAVVPAIALPHGRGALLGLGIAGGWMAVRRWPWALPVAVSCTVAALGAATFYLKGHDVSAIVDRFHIWGDAARGLTIFGRGIGSFGSTMPLYAIFTDPAAVRNEFAHNDLLEVLYELGIPGLIIALIFIGAVLRSSDHPERFVFAAFITESFFAFPSHLPATAVLGAIVAGCAARDLPAVRLQAFAGRIPLFPRHQRAGG